MSDGAKEYIDFWDGDNGGMSFRHMPETTLEGFIREEPESIFIHEDSDGFWLSKPGVQGQSRFDSLQEAKEAGDKVIEKAEAALPAAMLEDAGLLPSEWKFVEEEPTRFVSLAEEGDEIHVMTGGSAKDTPYWAYAASTGDDLVGKFPDPKEAAAAIAATRSPKP